MQTDGTAQGLAAGLLPRTSTITPSEYFEENFARELLRLQLQEGIKGQWPRWCPMKSKAEVMKDLRAGSVAPRS